MGSASSTTRVALEIQNRVDIDVPESLYAHVPYGPRIRVYALGWGPRDSSVMLVQLNVETIQL